MLSESQVTSLFIALSNQRLKESPNLLEPHFPDFSSFI